MPSTTDFTTLAAGYLTSRLASGATSGARVTVIEVNGSAITWPTGAHRIQVRRKTANGLAFETIGVSSASQSGSTVTLGTLTRQMSMTDGSTFSTGGNGYTFPANSEVYVSWDVFDAEQTAKKDIANTFSAKQTFSVPKGGAVYATFGDLPAGDNGDEGAYVTADGQFYDYIAGSWQARASGTNPNGSTTVAGKYEEATVAEQGTATATGATGARLVPAVANLVKTSSGAGDENKLAVLNSAGTFNAGFLGTGTPDGTKFLKGDGSWGSGSVSIFGSGSDGAKTISASEDLNPSSEFNYTTLTLAVSQTLSVTSTNTPLVIHTTGDVTINGTLDLNSKGAAGGTGGTTTGSGNTGTAGNSKLTGYTIAGGGGGTYNAAGGGAGGGGSSVIAVGATGTAGAGAAGAGGAIIASNQLGLLVSMMRGVVCGSGGGGGPGFSGNVGVAGGIGGGASVWLIGGNLTLGASSTIRCSGGNGASSASVPGGGGGGGGTIIMLVAGSITNSGVTLTAAGGSGGTGVGATNGGAGAAGKIIIYSLSTGTVITSA